MYNNPLSSRPQHIAGTGPSLNLPEVSVQTSHGVTLVTPSPPLFTHHEVLGPLAISELALSKGGLVCKAHDTSGNQFAIKHLGKDSDDSLVYIAANEFGGMARPDQLELRVQLPKQMLDVLNKQMSGLTECEIFSVCPWHPGQTLNDITEFGTPDTPRRLELLKKCVDTVIEYASKSEALFNSLGIGWGLPWHGDAHGGNYIYDQASDTMKLIDFGITSGAWLFDEFTQGLGCTPTEKTQLANYVSSTHAATIEQSLENQDRYDLKYQADQ